MIRYLFFIVLAVIIFHLARQYIANSPPEQKRSRKIMVSLIAFAVVMLGLAATGRMHWLGAIIAAVLPVVKWLLQLIIPTLLHRRRSDQPPPPQAAPEHSMNLEEARDMLGLEEPFTKEQVIEAHRQLIQKVHPDRGGNDYLAARLNQARDLLLEDLNK